MCGGGAPTPLPPPTAYHAVFNHNGEVSLKAPILKLVDMEIHGDIRYP